MIKSELIEFDLLEFVGLQDRINKCDDTVEPSSNGEKKTTVCQGDKRKKNCLQHKNTQYL